MHFDTLLEPRHILMLRNFQFEPKHILMLSNFQLRGIV